MSIVPVIAVYASVMRELGRPLAFPGTAWSSLYQVTESAHFANGALWAATEPRCANQAYNITNGDYFRWQRIWPAIARVFDLQPAGPQPLRLADFMADKAPLWDALVKRHGLKPYRFDELVAWPFGDYVFGCDWDVMSSLTKCRLHGFHDVVCSEQMFVRLLTRFREERIVPRAGGTTNRLSTGSASRSPGAAARERRSRSWCRSAAPSAAWRGSPRRPRPPGSRIRARRSTRTRRALQPSPARPRAALPA
jgi:hypothetical protein